ncbi:MAG: hypothetical protein GF331_00740 [Chitinivibrionales bacterium]|nr:hypothetical protein [Chitinivibrionales bacterium]
MSKNELISLALIYSEPHHAYGLNSIIKEMNLEHWAHISPASIYNALSRLADAGCVAVTTEKVGNMPERKVYSITDSGRERLRDELRQALVQPEMGENPFYLAVSFAFGLRGDETIALLEQRIRHLETGLQHMDYERGHLADVGAKQALIILEGGMDHIRVEIKTVGRLIEMLRSDPEFYEREVTRQLREINMDDRSS